MDNKKNDKKAQKDKGKCIICGNETEDKNKFIDGLDDSGHDEFCCDSCYDTIDYETQKNIKAQKTV